VKEFDWLLILWVLGWAAALSYSLITLRRIQRRFDTTLEGSKGPDRTTGESTTKREEQKMFAFDAKHEIFRWEGAYEDKKAIYTHSVGDGYTVLRFEAGSDTLTVACFSRDLKARDVFALLPYRVEINARGFYRDNLLYGEAEPLIREMFESYFDRGVKTGIERLSLSQMETVEALLFGYRTYRRFQEFLDRESPDFVRQIQEYRGRPLLELLEAFTGGEKSREELLIELRRAVSEEDYEQAAMIRDRLKALEMRGRRTRSTNPSEEG
jgi:hypothetical protein